MLAYVRLKNEMEETQKKAASGSGQKNSTFPKTSPACATIALNLDLLEELARKDLGYSKKDEVVLFEKDQKK